MFLVVDIDNAVERLQALGGELVGEIVQYEDAYRLCYLRGPRASSSGSLRRSGDRRYDDVLRIPRAVVA